MGVIEKLQKLSSVEGLKDNTFRLHQHKLKRPSQKPIYIFGAKNLGQKALKACTTLKWDVRGFVDNNPQRQHQKLDGFPAYALEEPDKTAQPVIIASLLCYFEIKQQLAIAGFINCIDYSLLALYYNEFETHPCYGNVLEGLVQNKNKHIKFREMLYHQKTQRFDHNNYLTATENLKHSPNIEIFPKSICSQTETLKFHAEQPQQQNLNWQYVFIIHAEIFGKSLHPQSTDTVLYATQEK